MALELERLVVSLDARIDRLSKQLARATGEVDSFTRKADQSTKRAAQAMNDNLGRALRSDQIANLRSQALDVATSLSGGASPLQVLSQQSAQIYEALAGARGGVSGALDDLKGRFVGLITPARLAAGGLLTVGAAAAFLGMRWEDAQDKIDVGLSGVGKASGATVRQITEIGDAAAASGKMSAAAARDIATAVAATGKVDREALPGLVGLAPGYAKLFGKDLTEAGTDLARIFADPVKGADELDARLGILDGRTRAYIRTLAAQGDRQGAIRVLAQAAQPELERAASKTSLWARAWSSVEQAADAAGRAVTQATTGGSLEDRAREAERRRGAADAAARQGGNVNPVDPAVVAELRQRGLNDAQIQAELSPVAPGAVDNTRALARALQDATAEAERLEEEARKLGAQRFNDTLNAQARELSKSASDTTTALNAESGAIEDLENRLIALQKTVGTPRALDMVEDAEKTKASVAGLGLRLQQLKDDYAAGGAAAAAAVRAANFQAATAGLSTYARGLMEVNKQFDELRRSAIATTDLAKLPDTLKAIEAARGAATTAFNTETRERAREEIAIPADYYAAIRGPESGGDDNARSSTGAVGRYQFTRGTWMDLFPKAAGNRYGAIRAQYTDAGGKVDEDAVRTAVLALRNDPAFQEIMVRALTQRNAQSLGDKNFPATSRNLYLAHNAGDGGAAALLQAEREGRGEESAQSLLDRIDPRIVSANRAYYAGKTVTQALATVDSKVRGNSAESKAQQERVRALDAETASTGAAVAQKERLASIEEQLRSARENGEEVANRFRTADELLKNGTSGLTGEVKAQTEEILRNADARAQAASRNVSAGMRLDLTDAYAALGRTPGEQQDYLQARRVGAEGSGEFNQAYDSLQQLRTLTETKSAGSGFVKDLLYDLQQGASFADSLRGAISRLAGSLADKAIDKLFNFGFSGLLGSFGIGGVKAATGGLIRGPGSSTSDSIPAMLSDGEYVVNARAARQHLPLLRAINAGRARGFAQGGMVNARRMVGAMPAVVTARPPVARPSFSYRSGDTHITAPGADAAAIASLRGYVDAARAEDRRLIGQSLARWRENT